MRGSYFSKLSFAIFIATGVSVFAQTPVVSDNGVVNAVTQSRTQPIAAGSIVSIFGSDLASSTALADSIPLSTSIAGVTVKINDVAAPIRQISSTLISVQVPWEVTGDTANVVVTRDGVASAVKSAPLAQFSPGIYAINNLAVSNLALAINSDGSLAQPTGSVAGLNAHPASIGDNVVILATGLGPVNPPPVTGANSKDTVRDVVTPPQVMIGGVGATLISATLSPDQVGVYHVQVTVPDTSVGNAIPLQLQIGDVSSPSTTTMAVRIPPAAAE
jgi:uncharacterized protein (TIGR03437 family)